MKFSLKRLAELFELDDKTIAAALQKSGHTTGRGKQFTVSQVHSALTRKSDSKGSMQEERLLKIRAERMLAELELEKERGSLMPVEIANEKLKRVMIPIRQRWMALPDEVCQRCNPHDHKLAWDALQNWVIGSMKLVREQVVLDVSVDVDEDTKFEREGKEADEAGVD